MAGRSSPSQSAYAPRCEHLKGVPGSVGDKPPDLAVHARRLKVQALPFLAGLQLERRIDTSTPGKFVFAVMGAVAELERELIRERTQAGLQAARRRGARLGRPRATFDLNKAVELREAGQSYEAIASLLRV